MDVWNKYLYVNNSRKLYPLLPHLHLGLISSLCCFFSLSLKWFVIFNLSTMCKNEETTQTKEINSLPTNGPSNSIITIWKKRKNQEAKSTADKTIGPPKKPLSNLLTADNIEDLKNYMKKNQAALRFSNPTKIISKKLIRNSWYLDQFNCNHTFC